MENAPEYVEILLAAWHAGLVAVPINAKLHPKERDWILENSGARVCFTRDDMHGYAQLLQHDPIPMREAGDDDLAWLFYTSGTTGRPKGAMLTHGNLRAMIEAYFADVDGIVPGDSIVHAAPMSHGSGLYILPHLARAACHVIPESGGFEPDEVFALLRTHKGVTFFMAPTMVMRLVHAPGAREAPLANLKTIVYGGGPMYAEDSVAALDVLGQKLVQIYGQGESPMTITCLKREAHRDTARLGTVGKAFTGVEVAVAAPDEIGEVKVRGKVVMKGYWQNAAATNDTLRGGWLHTGDLGVLDGDGYLTLKDRSKDVIISGGANIYPREVEEVLLKHSAVAEAAVVGRRHADWGEEVVAFVVPRDGAAVSAAELDALCLENIARFKRPRDYRFVESLPKNNYGKVLKTELRGRTS
jgi:long-chain acyl-CoA synthetase